jgi:hypothetical protein
MNSFWGPGLGVSLFSFVHMGEGAAGKQKVSLWGSRGSDSLMSEVSSWAWGDTGHLKRGCPLALGGAQTGASRDGQ